MGISKAKQILVRIQELGDSSPSSLDTTLADIAKKSGKSLEDIKKKFVEIEKGVSKNVKNKSKVIAISIKVAKDHFGVN